MSTNYDILPKNTNDTTLYAPGWDISPTPHAKIIHDSSERRLSRYGRIHSHVANCRPGAWPARNDLWGKTAYSWCLMQTKLAYSRAWHLIDVGADQRSLGRIASRIAIVLMGKHKPIWDPSSL